MLPPRSLSSSVLAVSASCDLHRSRMGSAARHRSESVSTSWHRSAGASLGAPPLLDRRQLRTTRSVTTKATRINSCRRSRTRSGRRWPFVAPGSACPKCVTHPPIHSRHRGDAAGVLVQPSSPLPLLFTVLSHIGTTRRPHSSRPWLSRPVTDARTMESRGQTHHDDVREREPHHRCGRACIRASPGPGGGRIGPAIRHRVSVVVADHRQACRRLGSDGPASSRPPH